MIYINEIGSFFGLGDINSNVDEAKLECRINELTGFENTYLLCSGREAIEAVVKDIEIKTKDKKKRCLLPMYTCDTVIIPFIKCGWEVNFYPIHEDLSVNIQEFENIMSKKKPTILLLHSYYGVDTLASVRVKINEYKKEYGTFIIEDMTQSIGILAELEYAIADYYVCSLRKWFDIPDGAFVATNYEMNVLAEGEKELFLRDKIEAQMLKRQYLCGNNNIMKMDFLVLNRKAEDYLYENDEICGMSSFSKERMQHICIEEAFEKRKRNSAYLEKYLSTMSKIRCVRKMQDASPLYFPIYVENRIVLQEWLKENDIFAPILWSIPNEVRKKLDDVGMYIYSHLLALPCDQRYSIKDMKRIIMCIQMYERKEKDK